MIGGDSASKSPLDGATPAMLRLRTGLPADPPPGKAPQGIAFLCLGYNDWGWRPCERWPRLAANAADESLGTKLCFPAQLRGKGRRSSSRRYPIANGPEKVSQSLLSIGADQIAGLFAPQLVIRSIHPPARFLDERLDFLSNVLFFTRKFAVPHGWSFQIRNRKQHRIGCQYTKNCTIEGRRQTACLLLDS